MNVLSRLAHHIFVTDVASCIFLRSYTYLSPFRFRIETPCYQVSWIAPSSSECLKSLRELPAQISIATALKKIRSATLHDTFLFDSSDFGMHVIIIGQCPFKHQVTCYAAFYPFG